MRIRLSPVGRAVLLTAAIAAGFATAGPPLLLAEGQQWEAQGPRPSTFGQVENVRNSAGELNDEVTGAVHTVVSDPNSPQTLFIGTVNGGVWRTRKALSTTEVTWEHLTGGMPSESIGALDLDPTNGYRTVLAGIGRFSSFSRIQGGALLGLLRSTNRGDTWTHLTGGGALIEKNISGVASRGATIVVSVNTATPNDNANRGVWRSIDTGATFQIMSRDDLAFGLPSGVAFDLVGDPQRRRRLFVPITSSTTGANGIYRSDDTGATWTKVSDAAVDTQLAGGSAVTNVELAVGKHNNVFVAIARAPGRLAAVFRSGDGGDTWTAMSIPITPDPNPHGVHPGAQSFIHMGIAADKLNPNIVYISGDRQPDRRESGLSTTQQWPNSLGATDYSGRIFRGDASQPLASQWAHMTHSPTSFMPTGGTASHSSPHADSREIIMDEIGDVIEVDDGGVYRRTKPQTNEGDWFSLNGNLQVAEQHSLAYDSLAKVSFTGNQDTGTPIQLTPDGATWESLTTADGGVTVVDDHSTPAGTSMRITSFQGFQVPRRSFWDADNNLLSVTVIPLTPLGGAPRPTGQFYTPLAVNRVNGARLLIGGGNGLYESMDRGDTVARIDLTAANQSGAESLAYGATNNPDAIYMGRLDTVRIRLAPPPAALVATPSFGATVVGVQMHPNDANVAFVATNLAVFMTTNGGGTWANISGNLPALNPNTLRTLNYVLSGSANAVVVGSLNGAFYSTAASGFTVWQRLGTGLPTAPVYQLEYSRVDDVLVAGTLGRGAYKMRNAAAVLAGVQP